MHSIKKSRTYNLGCPIRGDIMIKPLEMTDHHGKRSGVSADPNADLQRGAMHILSDAKNHNMCYNNAIMSEGFGHQDINVHNM